MEALLQKLPSIESGLWGELFKIFIGILVFSGLTLDLFLFFRWRAQPPDWKTKMENLRAGPWRLADGLVLLTTYSVVVSLSFLLSRPTPDVSTSAPPVEWHALLIQTLFFPILALTLIVTLVLKNRVALRPSLGIDRPGIGRCFAQGAACYLAALPVMAVLQLVFHLLGYDGPKQGLVLWLASPSNPTAMKLYVAGVAVLVVPVMEETLFRGIMLPAFVHKARGWLAVFFVSLFFAAIHSNLSSLAGLTTIAVAFSIGYIYSGSILVPIFAHALFNTFSLIAIVLVPEQFLTGSMLLLRQPVLF